MAAIVAVTGLTGTGKSTAVDHIAELCGGEVVYLGQFVLEYLDVLGLPRTRGNEKLARLALRERDGQAVLVNKAARRIDGLLAAGVVACVDAVFLAEELAALRVCAAGRHTHLLALEADVAVRKWRLASRIERPFEDEEVVSRDEFETQKLHIETMLQAASLTILNNGSKEELRAQLADFCARMAI